MTRWQRLTARFDRLALEPPSWPWLPQGHLPATAVAPALAAAAGAWCAQPDGVAMAWLLADPPEAARHHAQALALLLDGSLRLARLGRAGGLRWRLQLKLREALAPAAVGAANPCTHANADPWDAGWTARGHEGRQHLAERFVPRRATLVLAPLEADAGLAEVAQRLRQRLPAGSAPVRWLWVGAEPAQPLPPQATVLRPGAWPA